jgi:hypothetical protein
MSRITEEHVTTAELAGQAENPGPKRAPQEETPGPLLAPDVVQDFRGHWDTIQAGFVDDPRTAVKEADELVASSMKRLAESFAEQRSGLEQQWGQGADVSTEDLRLALRKYRAFFQRLLTV